MGNNSEIRKYVEELFKDKPKSPEIASLKEEIISNMIDKIDEDMKRGLSYNEAFFKARGELGDINVLTEEIHSSENSNSNYKVISTSTKEPEYKLKYNKWLLVALSPFVYILLGMIFNLWATAWVIVPASAILLTDIELKHKIVALTPIFYVFIGLTLNSLSNLTHGFLFGPLENKWWAIAWILIPVNAIIFECVKIVKE